MDEAKKLQLQVKLAECEQIDKGLKYPDERVRVSIVHAREDIVMMVSYLFSIDTHLRELNLKASVALILLGCILLSVLFK